MKGEDYNLSTIQQVRSSAKDTQDPSGIIGRANWLQIKVVLR